MKIAVFGDCHIGSYGKKVDQETGLNARLLDTVDSLKFIVQDCRERGADVILFAGDMFRTAKPTPTELVMVMDALVDLGGLIWMVPGNHDLPRSAGENSALDPLDGFATIVDRPEIQDCLGVQVAFLPYPNKAQLAAALPEYEHLSPEEAERVVGAHVETILRGLAAQLDPGKPAVLLAHLSIDAAEVGVERSIMAGRDITIPLSAVPEQFQFSVFGHIHKAQDFIFSGRPNVLYTGSTDRIDFGEETEGKSYVMLDTDEGAWQRIQIPCRRYYTAHINFVDYRLTDRWLDESQARDAICRVKVTRSSEYKPDYAMLQQVVEQAGCWDFRGFVEDVQRTAAVRSEEIVKAQSLEELLAVWHSAKGCEIGLDELVSAAGELGVTL